MDVGLFSVEVSPYVSILTKSIKHVREKTGIGEKIKNQARTHCFASLTCGIVETEKEGDADKD